MRGYNFGGKKAELMLQRLRQLKRDPEAARRLLGVKSRCAACPYCGSTRTRRSCQDEWMAKGVLPACSSGPRKDAQAREKRLFRAWLDPQSDEDACR